MLVLVGFVVVFGSIVAGFTMHGGRLMVLIQVSEFIIIGIESHAESPDESEIFQRYSGLRKNHHAASFLTDPLKVLLTGTVDDHHLAEILDPDLEQQHEESMKVPRALQVVADALPGFGIVAAVLGVIITMGKIRGAAEEVGRSVGAALVGTFLGVLLAYGVVGPLARAIEL